MALTIVEEARSVTGGVDTHAGTHVAAALDPVGGLLGVREFPAAAAGYSRLLGWLGGFGTVCLAGIEGTGSYGAGLARHIAAAGCARTRPPAPTPSAAPPKGNPRRRSSAA
jgi:transposase